MNFEYEIKNSSRARRVSIGVYPNGKVLVTKPFRISRDYAESFLKSKERWVERKIKFQSSKINLESKNLSNNEILKIIQQRIAIYNQHYNFPINKISIKNQKTLWGSASRNKNLNFNHKIASLSTRQMDYIIVHELCHLAEFNHSAKFWALVALTIPDFRAIRKELKQFIF